MNTRWIILLAAFTLAACSGGEVRGTLGLDRQAPDEFRVVSRPPLSVPPEFNLRPPRPGDAPLNAASAEKAASELVLAPAAGGQVTLDQLDDLRDLPSETAVDPVVSGELASPAESQFLTRLGAGEADAEIRSKLYQDNKTLPQEAEDEASPLEQWLGVSESSSVIDPKAEAERIRENKDEGKPVNEGEVKTVDPKKQSVLDRLF